MRALLLMACFLCALVALLSLLACWSYRALVLNEAAKTTHSVSQGHGGAPCALTYTQRGEHVPSLHASLLHDLRKAREGRGVHYTSGYYMLIVDVGRACHTFIWSPRARRFVHFANWGGDCREVHCRYRFDPQCGSIGPGTATGVCECPSRSR